MSSPSEVPGSLQAFPDGLISERLAQLRKQGGRRPESEVLERCQIAASVLATVDPGKFTPGVSTSVDVASLLDLVPSANSAGALGLTLPLSIRKRTLRQLHTSAEMQKALQIQERVPDTLLQRTFVRAVEGGPFDVASMAVDELSALAAVSDWLEGTQPGAQLPAAESLQFEIERRRDRGTLQRLADEHFVGRADELEAIREFIAQPAAGVLTVTGMGGCGKSALVSRAILDWTDPDAGGSQHNHWVRVDLDHSFVKPDQPTTIMAEVARHISRVFPALADESSQFLGFLARFESKDSSLVERSDVSTFSYQAVLGSFLQFLRNTFALSEGSTFIIWIDTFEEAQFLGKSVVEGVVELATEACKLPAARAILSGRMEIKPALFGRVPVTPIRLPDLEPAIALSLLSSLCALQGKASPEKKFLASVVKQVGTNPLILRLVSSLLAKEHELDAGTIRAIGTQALQQRLYSRILAHIHDEDVRKLAIPGIVMRRITTGVIRHVLALPCGLGRVDEARAQRILDGLAEEVTLVEKESDGTLRHRQDLRQIMLAGMPEQHRPTLREIDEAAVTYWSGQDGPIAAAEAIYHRLRLEQAPEELDGHWVPAAGPLLRSALDELPGSSRQRFWLANKLRAAVDDSAALGSAESSDWEQQAYLQAKRLLAANRAEHALQILSQRIERKPQSRLHELEARAWLAVDNLQRAVESAWTGIDDLRESLPEVATELALLVAYAEQRRGELEAARGAAELAVTIAGESQQPQLLLQAKLRVIRLQRLLGGSEEGVAEVDALAASLGPNALSARPDILRDLVAEAGASNPEWIRLGTSVLMDSLLETTAQEDVVALMIESGLASAADAVWMVTANAAEFGRLARSRFEERLYSEPPGGRIALAIQAWFRRSNDELVHRRLKRETKRATRARTPTRLKKLPRKVRQELIALLQQYPADVLYRITRFQLRVTIPHVEGRGPDPGAMIDRALKLQRFEEFVADLIQSAPSADLRLELGSLFPQIQGRAPLGRQSDSGA